MITTYPSSREVSALAYDMDIHFAEAEELIDATIIKLEQIGRPASTWLVMEIVRDFRQVAEHVLFEDYLQRSVIAAC